MFYRVILFFVLIAPSLCVDKTKFRTCTDTRFCRIHRRTIDNQNPSGTSYMLETSSLKFSSNMLMGTVLASINDPLHLTVSAQVGGSVRVKLTESKPRWQPSDLLLDSGLAAGSLQALLADDVRIPQVARADKSAISLLISTPQLMGDAAQVLVITPSPLRFDLYSENTLLMTVNERSFMHFEQSRGPISTQTEKKTEQNVDKHGGREIVSYGEDGLAVYADGSREEKAEDVDADGGSASLEEGDKFGGHTDTQPLGPMSVGLDFSFPFAEHVYGIPEHTSPLSLPTSAPGTGKGTPYYTEPYRLYNLDVFEYELDKTMALYGHIPLMLAHGLVKGKGVTAGMFWFNPSETFVDISEAARPESLGGGVYKQSHWISETGDLDFFLLPGPNVKAVHAQYTALTGTQQLPPIFALGYHQCRWNYRDERDVASVEDMFEQLDYPMDVIWLDIEHTDGKRYFTWDKSVFPNPVEMQKNVSAHGRRMVTIVDPHIKRDDGFAVHKEATQLGYYVKNKDGGDFDGWCWPGSSSYLDFTNPQVRQWWAERFSLDKYVGSTMDLFTWNDMNEPSVFNGPEVSMPKDCKNLENIEHRYWHNLYGLYMQSATAEGLTARSLPAPTSLFGFKTSTPVVTKPQRPFVLSRAFWAGSQRFGAIWTGDNSATWGHLKIASPMLLSINLAGLSFAGSDVGGFFGEPGAELFTRWYQAGSFTPFFRGHAHHDTKRREPWVFGEPYTTILRSVALVRYSLLPYWYSVFFEANFLGLPVMRAMFMEFPDDPRTFAMDDQWMVGDALLVKPVTDEKTTRVSVYLPTSESVWYDFTTLTAISSSTEAVSVEAPLDKIPVFLRGGKILPRKMRLRRSSKLMFHDPLTLIIAPNVQGQATGSIYMDDEITVAHASHSYSWRALSFDAKAGVIACSRRIDSHEDTSGSENTYRPSNTVERIVIAGQSRAPLAALLSTFAGASHQVQVIFDEKLQTVTLKKPDVAIADDWTITLTY